MLNSNKRSITIDSKHPEGKKVLEELVPHLRRHGRELRPRRALDRMGFTWAHIQSINPKHDPRLREGLRPGRIRGLQGL